MLARIDHLVYATPDLALGVERVEAALGVRPTPGGQHPGRGTRNALVALGPASYLEIIGPDPGQTDPATPRSFGLDTVTTPRLVTWAVKSVALDAVVASATRHGIDLGRVLDGSRRRPDGVQLAWRLTSAAVMPVDGLVPFFIDWGSSPHPARSAAMGATLVDLRAEHPDADRVQAMLRALDIELVVGRGPAPALIATIDGPHGHVELR